MESLCSQSKSYENNPVSFYHLPRSLMPPINGLDNYHGIMNNAWICNYINTQHKINTSLKAVILRQIHKEIDNCDRIEQLLIQLQGSYAGVMTDEDNLSWFQKLLDKCGDHQLYIIVEDIEACKQSFVDAAFCKQGYFEDIYDSCFHSIS